MSNSKNIYLALLACCSYPSIAWAQTDPAQISPPTFSQIDENGVDLATGRLAISLGSISIGPNGPGGLGYIAGTDKMVQRSDLFGYIEPNGSKYLVVLGGNSVSFTLTGNLGSGSFAPDNGNGDTLTYGGANGDYNYISRDGTVSVFQGAVYRIPLRSITYTNGVNLKYYYYSQSTSIQDPVYVTQGIALKTVTSSLGYQLWLDYSTQQYGSTNFGYVSKARVFNNNLESCDPNASTCNLAGVWPSLTISGFGGTVTDNLGHTTTLVANGGYDGVWQLTLPGGRQASITVGSTSVQGIPGYRVARYFDGRGTWIYNTIPSGVLRFGPDHGAPDQYLFGASGITAYLPGATNNPGRYYSYDTQNRIIKTEIRPSSGTSLITNFTYDLRGNVTSKEIVSASPGSPANIMVHASYPPTCANAKTCNKPDYVTDALGSRTDFTYDPNSGGVASVLQPAGQNGIRPEKRFAYSPLSAIYRDGTGTFITGTPVYRQESASQCATTSSCSGTADEIVSTISYGANDGLAPISITNRAGDNSLIATTTYTYTATGDVKTEDGPLAGSDDLVRNYYDELRRPIGTIGPDPDGGGPLLRRALRTTYSADGAVASQEAGVATDQSDSGMAAFQSLEQTNFTFDAQGRKATETFISAGVARTLTQYSYTAGGLLECTADRMNAAAFGQLPASACTQGTAGSDGPDRISRTTYDAIDRVANVTTGVGTSLEHTEAATTYDPMGRRASITDANGNRTSYSYDGVGRTAAIYYPDKASPGTSSSTDYETFAYDAGGNVTSRRNRAGQTIATTYDARSNPVTESAPSPFIGRTYLYDNIDRPRTIAMVGGETATSTYDALGRVTQQAGSLGTVTSQYDTAGNRTRMIWPDGFSIDYDYDVLGVVKAIRETGQTSGPGVLAQFSYDNLGRRVSMSRGNGTVVSYAYSAARFSSVTQDLAGSAQDLTVTFGYNAVDQLTSRAANNPAYSFGGAYNVNRSYAVNGLNQQTSSGSVPLGYDANGNLSSSGSDTYSYDHLNRLIATSNAAGATTIQYDPLDRLSQLSGSVSKRFLYDGTDVIGEYDAGGTVLRRYVHGLSDDEPLVWYEGAGVADRRWLVADERGSIVAVTNTSGVATAINTYDEFGIPAPGNAGLFGYTGQVWLPQLGVYSYKARMYSPTLGRFLQTDPAGYADGLNWYLYAHDDPMNGWDPSGLQDCTSRTGTGCGPQSQPAPAPDIVVTGRRISNEQSNSIFTLRNFREAASIAAQFTPAGEYLNVYTLVTGQDLITGQKVGTFDRIVGVIPFGRVLSKVARIGKASGLAARIVGQCGCVEAGTLVATPGGDVAIEQIKVGSLVLSKNELTGEVAAKPVIALIRPAPKPLLAVSLRNAAGRVETLRATADHAWTVAGRGWVETSDLRLGDKVISRSGKALPLTAVKATRITVRTYNLEVADWHTFFAGKAQVLVHNSCANKLSHVFDQAKHQLGPLLAKFGGNKTAAFNAVQTAANRELSAGRLVVGPNGILPSAGNVLTVDGIAIQLSGGRVINGAVSIGSFSSVIRMP